LKKGGWKEESSFRGGEVKPPYSLANGEGIAYEATEEKKGWEGKFRVRMARKRKRNALNKEVRLGKHVWAPWGGRGGTSEGLCGREDYTRADICEGSPKGGNNETGSRPGI